MASNKGQGITTIGSPQHVAAQKTDFQLALPQILAVMVKNILLLTYGTTIGYTTILIPGLSGNDPKEKFHLNDNQISWIGSITLMCVPLGCFLSGIVTQPIGRRRSMQIINIPIIACWLVFYYAEEVWQIYFALALSGFVGGLFEAPILTYVAEITQPHLRGMLSATAAFSIMIGILLEFLLGTFFDWRTLALVSLVFPIMSFFLLMFVPESPHWYVMRNKFEEARQSLAWLRGWVTVSEIEDEFQELKVYYTKEVNDPNSKLENVKNYFKKSFLWPLSLVSFIYFLVNFSGSTTLQTYAIPIFGTLQAPIDKYYATVCLGVAEFIACVICVFLVRFAGKRKMAFFSILGTGVCALIVGVYAYLIDVKYMTKTPPAADATVDIYKWIPLVFVILLAFFSHCGIRALPWILISEIYPKETRSTGCGISGGIAYIFAFLANKTFLQLVTVVTIPGMFWFNTSLCFIGAIVLYFILPETEGKSLQEITDHFSGISKMDNKIKKRSDVIKMGVVNAAYDDKLPDGNQNKYSIGDSKM